MTAKQLLVEKVSSYPIGRRFTVSDLRKELCVTVTRAYVRKLLKNEFCIGSPFNVRCIPSYASTNHCENEYYRMPESGELIIAKAKIEKLGFQKSCSEIYLREVLRIIFEHTRKEESFTPGGMVMIINSVVADSIRRSLPLNLKQVITDICRDFSEIEVCGDVIKKLPKAKLVTVPVVDASVMREKEQLDRIEKKLDDLLFILKPTTVKAGTVAATPVGPLPVTPPIIFNYEQSSTIEDVNFLLKSE